MIHPGLEALKGHWDKEEYAAGYRARLTAIPDFDGAHHCWRVGWEDADTEMLELAATITPSQRAGKTTTPIHGACSSTPAAMHE
jgi:hypothetical protein